MKTSRFIAGLSAAIIATSMTAAIPASAGQSNATGTATATVANYDLIDVVNAFKDAGFDASNVQNIRNFLILNAEFFDGNDYKEMIDTVNEIKTLYIDALAKRLFGKAPKDMTVADRYHLYDNLQPASRDAIKKRFEKLATKFAVKTEWSTVTVKSDVSSVDYALWYGTLDTSKAVRKADIEKTPAADLVKADASNAAKISKCDITLAGNKIVYKSGTKRAPKVTVTYKGTKLVKGRDYTLSYKNIEKDGKVQMGKVAITVNGTGNYSGKKTVYYYVVPDKAVLDSASGFTSKGASVYIKKDVYAVDSTVNPCSGGYQIQFCANKNFKTGLRTFATKSLNTTSLNFGSYINSSTPYVRVRAFLNIDGQRRYSAWSSVYELK
jgi:hypothetical protein